MSSRKNSLEELIRKYLANSRAMQVATVDSNRPWICTVYFAEDSNLNLYWLSLPSRRHSQQITKNNKAAAAIAVKLDQPVIGIQISGKVVTVNDKEIMRKIMKTYTAKHSTGKDFYDNFLAGKNQHAMYKLEPNEIVLFDEVSFSDDPRQTLKS